MFCGLLEVDMDNSQVFPDIGVIPVLRVSSNWGRQTKSKQLLARYHPLFNRLESISLYFHRPIQSISRHVRMSFVVNPEPHGLETSGQRAHY